MRIGGAYSAVATALDACFPNISTFGVSDFEGAPKEHEHLNLRQELKTGICDHPDTLGTRPTAHRIVPLKRVGG